MQQNKDIYHPFFSIVVPSYNVQDYLEECVKSLLNQSFKNFEIILVNDKSTDNTLDLCNYLAEKDDRIKVVENPINVGLAETRNSGLRNIKGSHVVFVDSDDFFGDIKILEKLHNNFEDYDMIFYGLTDYDDNIKQSLRSRYDKLSKINSLDTNAEKISYLFITHNLCWSAWTHAYKTSFLKDNNLWFDKDLRQAEDCDFFYKVMACNPKFKGIDDTSYMYRQRSTSLTGNPKSTTLYGVKVTKQSVEVVKNANLDKDYKEALYNTLTYNYMTTLLNVQRNIKGKEKREALNSLKYLNFLNKYGLGKQLKISQELINIFGINFGSWLMTKAHRIVKSF